MNFIFYLINVYSCSHRVYTKLLLHRLTGNFKNNFSDKYLLYNARYASLYFCCCIEKDDNELLTLEIIHRYVELLDKYFGSVCELG
jgi:hypothetical protein